MLEVLEKYIAVKNIDFKALKQSGVDWVVFQTDAKENARHKLKLYACYISICKGLQRFQIHNRMYIFS